MSDKHINDVFVALKPTNEQEGTILQEILLKSKNKNTKKREVVPLKRFKPIFVATALAFCLFTTIDLRHGISCAPVKWQKGLKMLHSAKCWEVKELFISTNPFHPRIMFLLC